MNIYEGTHNLPNSGKGNKFKVQKKSGCFLETIILLLEPMKYISL